MPATALPSVRQTSLTTRALMFSDRISRIASSMVSPERTVTTRDSLVRRMSATFMASPPPDSGLRKRALHGDPRGGPELDRWNRVGPVEGRRRHLGIGQWQAMDIWYTKCHDTSMANIANNQWNRILCDDVAEPRGHTLGACPPPMAFVRVPTTIAGMPNT
ncbi:protein of unknown function [Azospirillum baldaniorum]|uniref:Uncharacterized protein n=1 Tax=Azospirillum baldaniorum TaxID=1064539 RepID=A0A9P1NLV9_9PROT|nr:protein of unknown function [Azospirillum baldaniorum]